MRPLLVGLLILMLSAAALAQARGQVLSVGFNNLYRPDCWTPMLVQLQSQSQDSVAYQIQIQQEDLDRDRVTYTQDVTLGGNVEGSPATTENFWVYFQPQPTDYGLPDARVSSATLATLNDKLKVFLCDKNGKQICTLPMTSTIQNVDPYRTIGDSSRASKLILFVSDGADSPLVPFNDLAKGILEDVEAVGVSPRDLPSNVIGYEGVDTIVWMDADANFLISGTRTPALEAIQQWVRQGGHLVICQPPEPFKIKPFADMLPVGGPVNDQWTIPMQDRPDADILRQLANQPGLPDDEKWPRNIGPFKVARAPALPGSKVDEWMQWRDGAATSYTPWLARRGIGLGSVTWVAQDLGNAVLTHRATAGWRYIWDRVFDWNNPRDVPEDYKPQDEKIGNDWIAAGNLDLGRTLETGNVLDLSGRAAAYLIIAVGCFVLYWLIAGLGTYFIPAAKNRAHLSWYLFGLSAIVATALTALLVKLVVRGPPELRHISIVRYAVGDANATIDSRFGLYIKQDGLQQIDLLDAAPHQASYIAPFAIPLQYADNSEDALPAYLEYQIPVPSASDSGPVSVSIPYRSTSKKLQTHWIGPMKGTIEVPPGMPDIKIDSDDHLEGTLVNHTGYDLWHVFLAFKQPRSLPASSPSTDDKDTMVYVQKWPSEGSLKLDDVAGASKNLLLLDGPDQHRPLGDDPTFGEIGGVNNTSTWASFWRERGDGLADDVDDVLPMLMVFDHLPPWKAEEHSNRYELFRRGGRRLDLSAAMSAGELVVCAQGLTDGDADKTPLAVPLTVADLPVTGKGKTIFEFVLPLDRSVAYTQPATRPISP